MMPFVAWLDLDSVYTLFALRQPLGITGLPQNKFVTVVRQMILSRVCNMPSSTQVVPPHCGLSWQEKDN